MELEEYINQKKRISSFLLDFIDCEEELERENKFKSLVDSINTMKRTNDDDEIFEFLQLITIIANDHHRIIDFFNKIEIVLLLISDCIKEKFSNHEIFNIFRYNKRLLLILIENNILSIDEYIINFFLEKRKPITVPEINITEEKYEHALLTDDEKSESDEEESESDEESDEIIKKLIVIILVPLVYQKYQFHQQYIKIMFKM